MVCAKKTKSAAAVVATAASSVYQSYNATGTGVVPAATGAGTAALLATTDASSSSATAANTGVKGFNYGAFFMDYSAKKQSDFEYEFERAQDLTGTTGWTSARLYTMSKYLTASRYPDEPCEPKACCGAVERKDLT